MDRMAVVRELAAGCRRSHAACLAAIGWLALELPTEQLEALNEVVQETGRAWEPKSHLEAFEERWGRRPQSLS